MSVNPKMILLFQSFDWTAVTMLNWKFVFAIDFVSTATSLENLSNMFEIGNHKKTHYSSNKFEGMVHMTEVVGEFLQFWLSNLKFCCHGDLHCKFEQDTWNHLPPADTKNIEYAVHTTGVFTKFV